MVDAEPLARGLPQDQLSGGSVAVVSDRPFTIRAVSAAETRPLRQRVLRAQQTIDAVAWPHDDDPDALHAAAFAVEPPHAMVGTSTIHREPPRASHPTAAADAATAWRLRGMATDPTFRRAGIGAALVDACLAHAAAHGGTLVWCDARIVAATFYTSLGFTTHGEPYELPVTGPHYLMSKRLV